MYVIRCDLPCKEAKLKPDNVVSYRAKIQAVQRGRSASEEIILMAWSKMFQDVKVK